MFTDPPSDSNLVWFLCSTLGIGQLFPWNAFISAYDYFTHFYKPFPFVFALPIAYNWGCIVAFSLLTKYGGLFSPMKRLYGSYILTFLVLFGVPLMNLWNWNKDVRIWVTLGMALIAGAASAVMNGTAFSMIAVLPSSYTGAVMSGQGIAGILAGALKICVNFWWFKDIDKNSADLVTSGVLYFGIASLIIIGTHFATWILTKTRLFKHYHDRAMSNQVVKIPTNDSTILLSDSNTMGYKISAFDVFKQIWIQAMHVFLIFFSTLALFPGFTTRMRNYDPNLTIGNYIVLLISLFQLFDTVGRTLPKWFNKFPAKLVPLGVWLRVFIFTPIFMLMVYTDFLHFNMIGYVAMALFATSNGYLSTMCMMNGPSMVSPQEASTAGTLMSFFLQFGVFSGVHMAMILLLAIEGPQAVIN